MENVYLQPVFPKTAMNMDKLTRRKNQLTEKIM